MKTLDFKTITKYTSEGHYGVDYDIDSFPDAIDRYIDRYKLQMNPDFQRGHVWTESQQIAFVEFVLRGGQLQPIRLNNTEWNSMKVGGEMVCVDGLQRTTALMKFAKDLLPVFGGYFRSQLVNFNTNDYMIRVTINGLRTRAEVLNWYIELNSGGTVHTEEDIDKVRKLLEDETKKNDK